MTSKNQLKSNPKTFLTILETTTAWNFQKHQGTIKTNEEKGNKYLNGNIQESTDRTFHEIVLRLALKMAISKIIVQHRNKT